MREHRFRGKLTDAADGIQAVGIADAAELDRVCDPSIECLFFRTQGFPEASGSLTRLTTPGILGPAHVVDDAVDFIPL